MNGYERAFRGPRVCELVGISYRQLDYWARTELLSPSITEAKGSGTQRRYSRRDVIELKIIKAMLDSGQSLQMVRLALEAIKNESDQDLYTANIVQAGSQRTIVTHTSDELIEALRNSYGIISLVPVPGIVHELDVALQERVAG